MGAARLVARAASRGEDRSRRGTAAAGLDGTGSGPQAGLVTGRGGRRGAAVQRPLIIDSRNVPQRPFWQK